jgi:hypothetical protein
MLELLTRWWSWLAVSAGVVLFDQLTKHLVQDGVPFGSPIRVAPFFDLVLVYNPGAAFSFLSTAAGWQRELFIAIAAAASVVIVILLRRNAADRLFCFALSLISRGRARQPRRSPYVGRGCGFSSLPRCPTLLSGLQPGRQRNYLRCRPVDLGQPGRSKAKPETQ